MNQELIDLPSGGDKRTVGNVDRALATVEAHPVLIRAVLSCMREYSAALAMRAADCLEKLSRTRPELLQMYSNELLTILVAVPQKEIRWQNVM